MKDLNIHSNNNDVSETRNDILNDLNVFNENEVDNKILEENINEKDKNMKFPDISNIEENKEDKFEIDRNKVLADIKKKYGVKVHREDEDYQKEIEKEEREKLEKELEEERNLYNNQNRENQNEMNDKNEEMKNININNEENENKKNINQNIEDNIKINDEVKEENVDKEYKNINKNKSYEEIDEKYIEEIKQQ